MLLFVTFKFQTAYPSLFSKDRFRTYIAHKVKKTLERKKLSLEMPSYFSLTVGKKVQKKERSDITFPDWWSKQQR